MANCNDGQGVGFCENAAQAHDVGQRRCRSRGALCLAYSTLGTATAAEHGTCVALTPAQLGALMAKLSAAGGYGNCTMANLTIAEVLSL